MKKAKKLLMASAILSVMLLSTACGKENESDATQATQKVTQKQTQSQTKSYSSSSSSSGSSSSSKSSSSSSSNSSVIYEKQGDKVVVTGYKGNSDSISISSSYEGSRVTEIAASAFEGYSELKSVVLWADIERIGDSAFKNCSSLKSISIPSSATSIGDRAFENCSSLDSLTIWGNPDIGAYSFANCTSLKSVSFGSKTKKVGTHAFDGCSSLESVVVWGKDTVLEKGAFDNCPKLKNNPAEPDLSGGTTTIAETQKQTKANTTSSSTGIRPEFKAAMDSYEEYFDEYAKACKKFYDNPNDMTALTEYTKLMEKYSDTMAKLEAIDESSLNSEELEYYTKVNARIIEKLSSIN